MHPTLDLAFLAQADSATLALELARSQLDAAKAAFEAAKQAHEELLGQGENHGLPKAKLRKITEERVSALIESGLVPVRVESAKPEPKRAKKAPRVEAEIIPETWASGEVLERDAEITFLPQAKAGAESENAARA